MNTVSGRTTKWISALGLAIVLGTASPNGVRAQSSSSVPLFDTNSYIPRLKTPQPHKQPKRHTMGTRVNFTFDPASLERNIEPRLSQACAGNKFNQRKRGRYFVDVIMPNKPLRRFGFANSKGLNLRDPYGLRADNLLYLFEFDGTSECIVYTFPLEGQ